VRGRVVEKEGSRSAKTHVLMPGDIRINELILMVKVSLRRRAAEREGQDLDRYYLFTVHCIKWRN